MIQVNINETKITLSKLIQKVIDGEQVIIAKNNRPIVKSVLVDDARPKRRLGTVKGKIEISEDFDEPLSLC